MTPYTMRPSARAAMTFLCAAGCVLPTPPPARFTPDPPPAPASFAPAPAPVVASTPAEAPAEPVTAEVAAPAAPIKPPEKQAISRIPVAKAGPALDPKCPREGSKAPPFALLMSDGRPGVSLATALKAQKPIVLDFWAHWCGPCKAELPMLQRLATQVGDRATFLLVHVGPDETKMQEKLAELKVTIASASDDMQTRQKRYCAETLPLTFLIDAEGTIVERFQNLSLDEYERGLRTGLAKLGVK